MNQKGNLSIVIILIIAGILSVAGGIYWWQEFPAVPPPYTKRTLDFN